jgi:hypothetical protein
MSREIFQLFACLKKTRAFRGSPALVRNASGTEFVPSLKCPQDAESYFKGWYLVVATCKGNNILNRLRCLFYA